MSQNNVARVVGDPEMIKIPECGIFGDVKFSSVITLFVVLRVHIHRASRNIFRIAKLTDEYWTKTFDDGTTADLVSLCFSV